MNTATWVAIGAAWLAVNAAVVLALAASARRRRSALEQLDPYGPMPWPDEHDHHAPTARGRAA